MGRARRPPRGLPAFEDMSDTDKGLALRYVYRASPPPKGHRGAHWPKGSGQMFPCRYVDDPQLAALTPKQAGRHAMRVTGGQRRITRTLSHEEYRRLFIAVARRYG